MAEPPAPPGGEGNNNKNNKGKEKVVEYGKNRHGLPVGYYFIPKDLELLAILKCKLVHGELPGALNNVFERVRILDFHPALLHTTYLGNREDGYIYFFSKREFATKEGNKKRPVRVAKGGTWKASGGSKTVRSRKVGGVDVGQKLTMVFYERRFDGDKNPIKTNWGMHEFTMIIPGSKNKVEDLAVYRLYKIKKEEAVNTAATEPSTDMPSTLAAMAPLPSPPPQPMPGQAALPPPPPQPLPDMIGSPSSMALSLPLPGLAGSSSAIALPLLPLPALAGGMMSMADQANVASASQPYAASQTGIELMQDCNLFAYSGNWEPLPSSPPTGWSSPNGPVLHDGYLEMEDPTKWLAEVEQLMLPIAAIPPEPMDGTGQNSPAPPAVDRQLSPLQGAADNYSHHELVDYGGVQAQHEHHRQEPQAAVVDGADGFGDAQQGSPLAAAAAGPELNDILCKPMMNKLCFQFDDGTTIDFEFDDVETAGAPMLINDGGAGDAADGGDGGSQPHDDQQDVCRN